MLETTYDFRPVSEDDAATLTQMRADFFQTQVDAGLLDIPLDNDGAIARTTAAIMRGGRSHCLLAVGSDGIAAYIYYVIRTVPGMTKTAIGSVEEVYVAPQGQRQGLADQLVKRAVAHMRDLKADRIQARVIATNAPAVSFWDKQGFAENVRILEFSVDEV